MRTLKTGVLICLVVGSVNIYLHGTVTGGPFGLKGVIKKILKKSLIVPKNLS